MKLGLSLILFMVLMSVFASYAAAQKTPGAVPATEDLRAQLLDVQAKEAELQARARQLDEALKPENIERSLAGVGSTKPEELREMRRRQLNIERESVRAQLNLVETSRERLESAIRTAETAAYQQSAERTTIPVDQMVGTSYAGSRLFVGLFAGFIALLGIVLVITVIRRLTT